jgi:hypothetical protein
VKINDRSYPVGKSKSALARRYLTAASFKSDEQVWQLVSARSYISYCRLPTIAAHGGVRYTSEKSPLVR